MVKRHALRLLMVGLVAAAAPVLAGTQAAAAPSDCVWTTATSRVVTTTPYRLYVGLQVLRDGGFLCSNSQFRAIATLSASNTQGGGGTLRATVHANTESPGAAVTVPAHDTRTFYASDTDVSGSHCAFASATFFQMYVETLRYCP